MDHFKIAPSILAADFANLGQEVTEVIAAGADWIHVDVMDGHFVPNLTIGAPVVKALRKMGNAYLDCHLMITEPERYIGDFILAGANNITLHIESQGDMARMIDTIKGENVGVGITLRPATPLTAIAPYLDKVDVVLVMTVNPGFGGQSFMATQVDKIEALYENRAEKGYRYLIQVDGGINEVTKRMVDHADILVAGSYIFNQKGQYRQAIESLRAKR